MGRVNLELGNLVGHSYDRFSKANRGHGLVKMDEFGCWG